VGPLGLPDFSFDNLLTTPIPTLTTDSRAS
jgi:hypothetical protein